VLTPITKALTGRQATAVLTEAIEAFGGAGYVEDTGIPVLLRDAHVLPIWEGTTNVLALDALRTLLDGGMAVLRRELGFLLQDLRAPELIRISAQIEAVLEAVDVRLKAGAGDASLERAARRIALSLGRCAAATVLARHAQWTLDTGDGMAATAAVRRFAQQGLSLLTEHLPEDDAALLGLGPDAPPIPP